MKITFEDYLKPLRENLDSLGGITGTEKDIILQQTATMVEALIIMCNDMSNRIIELEKINTN